MYQKLDISKEQFLQFGAFPAKNVKNLKDFSMTILVLRIASKANGVSRLHATVSRNIWHGIWSDLPRKEVSITHITNDMHTNTWISYEFTELFDRYLGDSQKDEPADHSIWDRVPHNS